jgi:carbonic anhydrase
MLQENKAQEKILSNEKSINVTRIHLLSTIGKDYHLLSFHAHKDVYILKGSSYDVPSPQQKTSNKESKK